MGSLGTREIRQNEMVCDLCGEVKPFQGSGVCRGCAEADPDTFHSSGTVRCPGLARRV